MIRFLQRPVALMAPLILFVAGGARGETNYIAELHDHDSHHLNHGAAALATLSLNNERTHLSYRLDISGLNLKPNAVDRTEPNDVIGIHIHLNVPDTVGPHILNIFGLATFGLRAEEDADLVVDYANNTLSGVFDYSDATIDPTTGEPYLQFFPLTTKIIDDWLDDLDAGDLMFAVHTVATGFPTMAIHGLIHPVPEPAMMAFVATVFCPWLSSRRRRSKETTTQFRRVAR